MTEDEKKINDVEKRVDNLETKFEMFMKSQDERFNYFMQRQNELAADIRELRQDSKDMQKSFDAKIDKLDAKIDGIAKHVQTLSVAAVAGVGGMFVAIVVMVGTMVYSVLTR